MCSKTEFRVPTMDFGFPPKRRFKIPKWIFCFPKRFLVFKSNFQFSKKKNGDCFSKNGICFERSLPWLTSAVAEPASIWRTASMKASKLRYPYPVCPEKYPEKAQSNTKQNEKWQERAEIRNRKPATAGTNQQSTSTLYVRFVFRWGYQGTNTRTR